jgi:transcriptional regulator with XRE-family HTH domain
MSLKSSKTLPLPVKRALRKLGSDIRDARKRRRISTVTMSERAMINRRTLLKVEHGDPSVSMGIYATILFVLGMTDRLIDIADASHDLVGLDLESENLPKRIRATRRRQDEPGN